MPGETPGPSPEETALASVSVQEGVNAGRIEDKEVARAGAVAEKDTRETLENAGINNQENTNFYTKKGELRKGAAAEKKIAEARSSIEKIGNESGTKAAGEFANKSKDRVKNPDEALDMAYAAKPNWDMAANLQEAGSEGLAKDMLKDANTRMDATSKEYNMRAGKALEDITRVMHGDTKNGAALVGDQLTGYETVKQAVAGPNAQPAFELDKGRGKRKIHEAIYASPASPNVAMIERRNARTGELISVHTVATKSEAFDNRGDIQVPTKELAQQITMARKADSDPDKIESTTPIINSRGPNIPYKGDVGEYMMLQRRRLNLDSPDAPAAITEYRHKRAAQKKTESFWKRLFS